ncbi:hypothetical protein ACFL0B_08275 [Thermodesulfobacteriota bacterium]
MEKSGHTKVKNKTGGARIISAAIAVFIIAICTWFFVQNGPDRQSDIVSKHQSSLPKPSFDNFISVWNGIARTYELGDAHMLSSVNNEKMLRSLRGYIEFYSHPLSDSISQPINEIAQEYPGSFWLYYRDFLIAHVGKQDVSQTLWSSISSSNDLRTLILHTTGLSGMDESVKLLQSASDPCAYFNIYKYDLWDRGLSRNMESCSSDIIDKTKFPSLAELIRD